MARVLRTARLASGRLVEDTLQRIRRRGRSALLRALRIAGATVAAYLAAQAVGLSNPPPLVAALTALLVVQVTLSGTLTNGVQRVFSVVSGVALAVLLSSVVGLTWWSLGALVAASIIVGQLLRLGPHLVEVPISAMLVLGVGGAESAAAGRIAETLVGAAVGILVNLLFPPPVRSRHAGRAVEAFADEIANLLDDAAQKLPGGVSMEQAARWLEDARRLNRHAPRLDRALEHAEESRRLNVRALGTPETGISLRGGLDALEHCSVALRTLFRSVYDTARTGGLDDDDAYVNEAGKAAALLLDELAAVVRSFGRLLRAEVEGSAKQEEADVAAALKALGEARAKVSDLLLADPRKHPGLWEFNGTLLATVDRMLAELDLAEHARLRESERETGVGGVAHQAAGRLRATARQITDLPGAPPARPL